MANLLTATEAANLLRCEETEAEMLALLPLVDAYIQKATGRDWTGDNPIHPLAKSAARMLLVRMHEDPGGMVAGAALSFGLHAILTQMKAMVLQYRTFAGISGAGAIDLPGAKRGDKVQSLTGLTTGTTGDQSSAFETVISVDDQIQQTSTSDLSDKWFRAYLVPVEEQ